jgi:hypothetical protein
MNTVLVVMTLLGTTYTADFEVHYTTEAQCMHRKADYQYGHVSTRKASCVPLDATAIADAKELGHAVIRRALLVIPATGFFKEKDDE